jgi:adenosylcobyric acid synthase
MVTRSLQNNYPAACLAVLGTGSDVGKSIVTTALCRIFADRKSHVVPFKAQNLSNNSGVTPEGLEMGRAQIVQAEAARRPPQVDMNPVLLKPSGQKGVQVVLNGTVWSDYPSLSPAERTEFLFRQCCAALDRLRSSADVVVMEGAGSCAEINLMDHDIVNLRMASYASAPVLLVADIDRGGVFAQIIGTLACLSASQQDQIKGFIINRFHGDPRLFQDGVRWIMSKTGKPVLGVLPWFDHFSIAAEDAVNITPERARGSRRSSPTIAVIMLPHISNFTDFDALKNVPGLGIEFLENAQSLDPFRAVVLPGTKNTRHDLAWLDAVGWTPGLKQYAALGGHLLGICGGYQMLGHQVHDPHGIEGQAGSSPGLGLLPIETELMAPKTTTQTSFTWDGVMGQGYEIHMGRTHRQEGRPLFSVQSRNGYACSEEDGCRHSDGRILGTYIHGLFDSPEIIRHWLAGLGLGQLEVPQIPGLADRDQAYDQLAHHFKKHVAVETIAKWIAP